VTTSGVAPVRKSVSVDASVERAFEVFTAGFDSWWPRTHHIGQAPMTRGIIEGRTGGRCYTEHVDGSTCDWGQVTAWEPPRRLVLSWRIHGDWTCAPDPSQASEVEVRFTPQAGGMTRVDLEHRHLERHGAGAAAMRNAVDSPNGWTGLLQMYADHVGV
jgi:uncharacterized protein YndB with AHSA1/START domain